MEASALSRPASPSSALAGRSPLLRLQGDEKLIALTRRGNPAAFDALVHRYQARLQSFCRHMLGSTEDAEDVLQEVFTSAYNAIVADDRPINVRPWLYRIARNRSLNHLRRPQHAGQDSMDVFERAGGETTADAVHRREDFRLLIADVRELPETQRTALLMREIDALSYEQIAEAMETTVSSVKSLLVRARVGLAEAAEARLLSCDQARLALAESAEGIAKLAAPVRRHVKTCDRCRVFRGELRRTTRVLAAVYPVGPLVALEKLFIGKLGLGGGSSAGAGAGATGSGALGGTGALGGSTVAGGSVWGGAAAGGSALSGGLVGSVGAGGLLSTGVGAMATKAAAGLVAAAVVTAGAVEIKHVVDERAAVAPPAAAQAPAEDLPTAEAAEGATAPGAPAGPAEAGAAEPVAAAAEDAPLDAGAAPLETAAIATAPAGAAPTEELVAAAPVTGDGSSGGPIVSDGDGSGSSGYDGSDSGDDSGTGSSDGGSPPSDGSSSGGASDGGGDPGSVPPADGGEDPAPVPPAPSGDPAGSSTWASPEMHYGAGEPRGSGF